MSLKRRIVSVILGGLLAAAVAAAPAAAKVLHVTGQQTAITPSSQTVQVLSSHGVIVTPVAPAGISNGSLILPIATGFITTPRLNGAILHRGGVKFSNATRSLVLRRIVLFRVHHRAFLSARVHSRRLLLARVRNLGLTVSAGHATLTGELRLTFAGARKINHVFGAGTAHAGADLGNLTSTITFS